MQKYLLLTATSILLLVAASRFFLSKRKDEQNYVRDTRSLVTDMLQVASLAESVNNLYYSIWRKAAFNESKYLDGSKYMGRDLTESLILARIDVKSSIETIQRRSEQIKTKVKLLNNVPGGYTRVYARLIEMHELYKELTEISISPEENLLTIDTRTREIHAGLIKISKEIQAMLPIEEFAP